MSHVGFIDTDQRCGGCGERIPAGPMHWTVRTDVGKVEHTFFHEPHCPYCHARREASRAAQAAIAANEGTAS